MDYVGELGTEITAGSEKQWNNLKKNDDYLPIPLFCLGSVMRENEEVHDHYIEKMHFRQVFQVPLILQLHNFYNK